MTQMHFGVFDLHHVVKISFECYYLFEMAVLFSFGKRQHSFDVLLDQFEGIN